MTQETPGRHERIRQALEAAFQPATLEIIDESAKHASHVARTGITGGQTHYNVTMAAQSLAGLSRVARSRAVHEALAAEFSSGLHALSLKLSTPGESEKAN